MGKIKRPRQKFHQSLKVEDKNLPTESLDSVKYNLNNLIGKSPLLKTSEELAAIPDNLFGGINITLDSLNNTLTSIEDDTVSVRSVAKSCKYDSQGKLLTKKEKMKMKKELFMRKISSLEQFKIEALAKHKKRKGVRNTKGETQKHMIQDNSTLNPSSLPIALDSKVNVSASELSNPKEKSVKVKGIKKAKIRQREMLQEVLAFQKILKDPKFSKDPCSAVTDSVQAKIFGELSSKK